MLWLVLKEYSSWKNNIFLIERNSISSVATKTYVFLLLFLRNHNSVKNVVKHNVQLIQPFLVLLKLVPIHVFFVVILKVVFNFGMVYYHIRWNFKEKKQKHEKTRLLTNEYHKQQIHLSLYNNHLSVTVFAVFCFGFIKNFFHFLFIRNMKRKKIK